MRIRFSLSILLVSEALSCASTSPARSVVTTTGNCPTGWQLFMNNCYYVSADMVYQPDAQQACQERGANLVSIHSAAENAFVNMLVGGQEAWIGVIRSAPGISMFQNIDGTPLNFMGWNGAPDNFNGDEDCNVMNFVGNTGVWETMHCTAGGFAKPVVYVCEMPA